MNSIGFAPNEGGSASSPNNSVASSDADHGSKASVAMVRDLNSWLIVKLLRNRGIAMSRAAIAEATGLTRAAVGKIIDDLCKVGLVRPDVQHLDTNRDKFYFHSRAGYAIGIDMARSHLRVVLATLSGEILDRNSPEEFAEFALDAGVDTAFRQVAQSVRGLLERERDRSRETGEPLTLESERLLGIGIGIPGPLNFFTQRLVRPPLMSASLKEWHKESRSNEWHDVNPGERLAQELGTDRRIFYVDNDANMGALGVFSRFGKNLQGFLDQDAGDPTRSLRDLIYVKVGTGIGSGLILNGELYRGGHGAAGEIGHVTIVKDQPNAGKECACGKRGCLEREAGAWAIIEDALGDVDVDRNLPSRLYMQEVIGRARNGDARCRAAIQHAGEAIGIVLAELINFIDPSVVVLDGSVVEAGPRLLGPVRTAIQDRTMQAILDMSKVKVAAVPPDTNAIALGGVATVLNQELEGFVVRMVRRTR
jgi:predicted NBD/HSP70 family sugar kinase/biotin operon repressor